jgi:phosphoglycolate phosphatase
LKVIKCIIFDFDGTLVESNEIKKDTFYEVTKNIVGADSILDELFLKPDFGDRFDIFNTLFDNIKRPYKVNTSATYLSGLYTKICEYKISKSPEIPGAQDTLEQLKIKKIKAYVSSATPTDTLKRIIDARGWGEFFELIMGSPKSKEDHIKLVLSLNSCSVSEVAYVGDSEIDQNTSLLTGCKFVGVGKNWDRFDCKPDTLLDTLEKLIEELKL